MGFDALLGAVADSAPAAVAATDVVGPTLIDAGAGLGTDAATVGTFGTGEAVGSAAAVDGATQVVSSSADSIPTGATSTVTSEGNALETSANSPTGFQDSITQQPVNADGSPYTAPQATPSNLTSGNALTPTPPANTLNGALCQYTTSTGADATVPGSASSGLPSGLQQKLVQQGINQGVKQMLAPTSTPLNSKSYSANPTTPTQSVNNNYSSAPSSPLTPTGLFTGTSSGSGTFLSPLATTGLTPAQQNQLYNPSSEILGATTTPNLITGSAMPSGGVFPYMQRTTGFKEGGLAHTHKPEFVTGITGHYAQGRGTGQSDDIPAVLKDGDYVMDADIVAALGDGSNKAGAESLHHFMNQFPHKHYENHSEGGHINAMIADGEFVFPASLVTALGGGSNKEGAKKLDEMREAIREHKRSASINKIPPKAKSPLSYMEGK